MGINLENLFKKISSKKYIVYLTPQEIKLFKPIKKKYKNPYMPCILQDEGLDLLNKVIEERKNLGFSFSYPTHFFLNREDAVLIVSHIPYILCSLEDLNEKGETVHDPRAVDETNTPIEKAGTFSSFPFRRRD